MMEKCLVLVLVRRTATIGYHGQRAVLYWLTDPVIRDDNPMPNSYELIGLHKLGEMLWSEYGLPQEDGEHSITVKLTGQEAK